MGLKSRIAPLLLAGLMLPAAGHAALFRAYLKSTGGQPGADCSLANPCRYLPDALSAVASGGEIWILDSANFNQGTVNITKSVTILAVPGEVGSIQAIGNTPAIAISTAGVDVTLRNVVVSANALSPGNDGVYMSGGNSLTVEDSVIAGLLDTGIVASGSVHVRVKNTVFRNNAGALVATDGPTVDIIKCNLEGNANGIASRGITSGTTTIVQMSDSVIAGRNAAGEGAYAYTNAGAAAKIYITRSTIFQTGWALHTEGAAGSLIELSGSMVVRNSQNVVRHGSGVVRSLQNNHISDGIGADDGTPDALTPR